MSFFTKYVIGERGTWGRNYLGFAGKVWLYLTPIGWTILLGTGIYQLTREVVLLARKPRS